MNFETLNQALNSSSTNDWLFNDQRGIYTYKNDLNLRIERRDGDDDLSRFEGEEWATCHPDSNAYRVICEIYYGASFVEDRLLVAVDGYRAILPLPDIKTKEISQSDYRFASLINRSTRLEEYIGRAGLKISNS